MQNLTIRKGSKAFECKFEPFDRDSKHSSNVNSNHSKGFEAIECKFKLFKLDSKDSNGLKAFECKFEAFECKFEPVKEIQTIRMEIRSI